MKIGIVTFHSAHNYGAVLQAWSLQEYLNKQGHEVDIINLRLPVIDKLYRLSYRPKRKVCKSAVINKTVNQMHYLLRSSAHIVLNPGKIGKYRTFEHFINHELPVTRRFDSLEELQAAELHYDALISGSDQVWNATMMTGINPAYFLQFANQDALRISYAASIGTEEIPSKYQFLFKRYLRDFDSISVREKNAREQVQHFTDKPVELVADPTFLLNKEDFEGLKKDPKKTGKYIYVHNVHLKRVDESLNSVAEEMSRRLGLPIIHNWKKKVYANEAGHFTGGIEEFLGMVANAECVITNSFHCTVFSIIFQRNFITVPHYKNPDRMKFLLSELGISEHLIEHGSLIPEDLSSLEIDYEKVEEKRRAMGAHARCFLEEALKKPKETDSRKYLETRDAFLCYGCGACKDACPKQAIRMEEDQEGFRYPVIEKDLCDDCGICQKVCIGKTDAYKNKPQEQKLYLTASKEVEIQKRSSGGGFLLEACRSICREGGKAAGIAFDSQWKVIYELADKEEDCEKFREFKYVEPDSGEIKKKIKELLDQKEQVLFYGTPCQVAGLKSYLGQGYETLLTIESLCEGVASPKVYRKYLEHMERMYRSKLNRLEFSNKFKGEDLPFVLMGFESESVDVELAETNNFTKAYAAHNISRPSCYTCEYAGNPSGAADLSVGRYVPEEGETPVGTCGTSLVRINTQKGKEFFEHLRSHLEVQETEGTTLDKIQTGPLQLFGTRGRLMEYLEEVPIDDLLMTFNPKKKGRIKGI